MITVFFTILILVAAAPGPGTTAKQQQGQQGRGDSGRSLRSLMLASDEETSVPDLELNDERGMGPGLAPWPVQARLAAEEEFRRFHLSLLACRSRYAEALREAGPEVERVASLAVEAGRDFLERELDAALAGIPTADYTVSDSEIAKIQASLNTGRRYPAGDVLEGRWKRLVRMSRTPPDESVQRIRQLFRSNTANLWLVVERAVSGEDPGMPRVRVPKAAGARATINTFTTCLQHRLSLLSPT